MSDFEFVPATKEQAKARIALAGPSGSGKTWTSLILATGLAEGGRIAVIDTERGSASKYVGPFKFDRLDMYRYDPRDLVKAVAAATKAGYDVLIIDSLSRFWSGAGGMLEFVDNVTKRTSHGNAFSSGWKEARPVENDMIEAMLGYPGHVIATMRTKTHYDVAQGPNGKTVPVKIGLQPEQRNGIEYEFDVVADMDLENTLTVSKSRCPELSGQVIRRPDKAVAETLLAWLTDGVKGTSANDYRDRALDASLSYADYLKLYDEADHAGKLGAIVMDDTGEMTPLRDLIRRKGAEAKAVETRIAAAQASAPQPSATEPASPPAASTVPVADSDGNGQQHPAPPRPLRPANTQQPQVVTDARWLAGALHVAPVLTTLAACRLLWTAAAGKASKADAARVQGLLRPRMEELRQAGEGDGALDPADPWALKLEETGASADAAPILDELAAMLGAGQIDQAHAGRVEAMLLAKFPETAIEGKAAA